MTDLTSRLHAVAEALEELASETNGLVPTHKLKAETSWQGLVFPAGTPLAQMGKASSDGYFLARVDYDQQVHYRVVDEDQVSPIDSAVELRRLMSLTKAGVFLDLLRKYGFAVILQNPEAHEYPCAEYRIQSPMSCLVCAHESEVMSRPGE